MENEYSTPAEVLECLNKLREMSGDDESAHSLEDEMHQGVLRAIAHGLVKGPDAATLAGLALQSLYIDFRRWCA